MERKKEKTGKKALSSSDMHTHVEMGEAGCRAITLLYKIFFLEVAEANLIIDMEITNNWCFRIYTVVIVIIVVICRRIEGRVFFFQHLTSFHRGEV